MLLDEIADLERNASPFAEETSPKIYQDGSDSIKDGTCLPFLGNNQVASPLNTEGTNAESHSSQFVTRPHPPGYISNQPHVQSEQFQISTTSTNHEPSCDGCYDCGISQTRTNQNTMVCMMMYTVIVYIKSHPINSFIIVFIKNLQCVSSQLPW